MMQKTSGTAKYIPLTSNRVYSSEEGNFSVRIHRHKGTNLVDQGSRARDKLDVIAIEDDLILDLLRP
jgi:hypothetical protein